MSNKIFKSAVIDGASKRVVKSVKGLTFASVDGKLGAKSRALLDSEKLSSVFNEYTKRLRYEIGAAYMHESLRKCLPYYLSSDATTRKALKQVFAVVVELMRSGYAVFISQTRPRIDGVKPTELKIEGRALYVYTHGASIDNFASAGAGYYPALIAVQTLCTSIKQAQAAKKGERLTRAQRLIAQLRKDGLSDAEITELLGSK